MRRDHPRSRGVYPATRKERHGRKGSSPLARGLQVRCGHAPQCTGIIPARAGFTPSTSPPPGPRRDHPRSRGVYSPCVTWGEWMQGSSPLARGLHATGARWEKDSRIIPARAGFTRHGPDAACGVGDHPRSRGVYPMSHVCAWLTVGSSPLARGLPGVLAVSPGRARIIPARAGFTPWGQRTRLRGLDHPRSRGVYARDSWQAGLDSGSSPLARGLRWSRRGRWRRSRIIPARAGFTLVLLVAFWSGWDHPRSRGVYSIVVARGEGTAGSSPLARGLRSAVGRSQ